MKMRYKKILLINPAYKSARVKVVFSAGLGYVAESLGVSGVEYDVLDMSLGYSWHNVKEKIDMFRPDLIGISMMTYRYRDTYELIKKIKVNYNEIKIVTGGPHISLFREKVLHDCRQIDYGIVLEGEETLVELCDGNPIASIKGLVFRGNGEIIYNGDRPFIENLDAIFFPKYEKFELNKIINKNINALPLVSSRGCPFNCIYCPVACSIGRKFRARSPENIIKEILYWYEKGYNRFSFADDNFTLLKDRVYKFCELVKKNNLKLKLSCDNGIRADRVDGKLLGFMRDAGFYRIAFGVEGGNDKILKSLQKREDIETIKTRIKEAGSLEYEVDLFFLVGSPGETFSDLDDSFKIALDNSNGIANFYNIIPFPNTELFEWIEKNGKFLKRPDDYLNEYPILDNVPVFETNEMPEEKRKMALKRAFSITRKTMKRSWVKRLSYLGFIGKVFAYIYTTKFVQDTLLRNQVIRKNIYRIANLLVS